MGGSPPQQDPTSLRVVAGYFIFGVLWILLSDNILLYFVPSSSPTYVMIQSVKGWLFVSLSALLIYFILKNDLKVVGERERRITYQAGLLERVSDALISTDAEFKVVSWNPAAERLYGWSEQEVLGKPLNDFVQTDFGENFQDRVMQQVMGTGAWSGEVTQLRKDGRRISIWSSISAIRDDKGNLTGFIGVNRDLSSRLLAEEVLRESQKLYRELFESNPHPMWVYDLETLAFKMVNDAAIERYGYTREEFLGMTIKDIRPQEEIPALMENLAQPPQTLNKSTGWHHRKKDGSLISVEISSHATQFNGKPARLVLANDITERIQTEESLRVSEARFRALFENVPVGIWEQDFSGIKNHLDSLKARGIGDLRAYFSAHPEELLFCLNQTRILDVNLTAVAMYDAKDKQELIESTLRETNQGELENGLEEMISIAKGRVTHSWEGSDETMTGRPIEIRLNWSVVPGHEQDYSRVIVTTVDITERKQAEEALHASGKTFHGIFNNVAEAIYIQDADGRFLDVNDGVLKMYGHPREFFIGNTPELLSAPGRNDLFEVKRAVEAAFNGQPQQFEFWGIRENGEVFPKEVRLYKGAYFGQDVVIALAYDITERKRAEKALTQRLAELELLYQSGLALSGELEPKQVAGKIIEVLEKKMDWHHIAIRKYDSASDRLELLAFKQTSPDTEATARSTEERLANAVSSSGQGLSGWVAQHGQTVRVGNVKADARYTETYPGIGSGLYAPMTLGERVVGVISVESRELNAFDESDERLLKTIANQAAVAFENARLFQNLQHELNERIQAEKALRESEERMRLTLQTTSDGFWIVDQQGKFLEVNNAYCEMSGYSHGELLRMSISDVEVIESMDDMRRHITRVKHERHERFETRHRRKDGSQFDVEFTVNLLDEQTGLLICFCRDITERKLAEREVRQRTQDLALVNIINDAANRGESLETIINLFTQEAYSMFDCRDAAVYLISADGKYLEMHKDSVSSEIKKQIEDFIGISIPRVRLPIREGSHTQYLLSHAEGILMNEPEEIQKWILEFAETTFLPDVLRAPIRAIVPRIFDLLGIHSTITIPLVSSGQSIGLMDLSSARRFTEEDLQRLLPISRQMTAILLRKRAESNLAVQLKRITALNDIDRAISSSLDMRLSLEVLLKEVVSQLEVDAADILLMNPVSLALEYVAGRGFHAPNIRQFRLMPGQGPAGKVGLEQKVVHIADLNMAGGEFVPSSLLKSEQFVEYFGIPLLAKGSLKGVLEIFNRAPLAPSPDWLNYLETLGGQAAIAIDNAQLFEGLQRSNQEMMAAYDATIAGWSHAMDLRDKETEGHTLRVTEITGQLAARMGVSQQEQVQIRRGALLHDIGKLGVPDHILLKPGKLTEEEWDVMRKHPAYAYEMLLPIAYLEPALDIPYCHHEKWDGSGYPRGLKGEQIPLAARIFAIVDVWDALRSNRPYRPGWSAQRIREYLQSESGKHFDPRVVEAFLSMLDESPEMQ